MKRENCNYCPQVLYLQILIPSPDVTFQVIPYPNPAPDPTLKKAKNENYNFFLAEEAEASIQRIQIYNTIKHTKYFASFLMEAIRVRNTLFCIQTDYSRRFQ